MALSVVTHLALIAGATAATAGLPRATKPLKPIVVEVTPPAPKPIEQHRVVVDRNTVTLPEPVVGISIKRIEAPTTPQVNLPPIDMTGAVAADSIVIGGPSRSGGTCQLRCLDLAEKSSSGAWQVNELLMHLITPAKPRYPEALRQAGIEGSVLVRFVVDTLGRIDPASVQILSSTHDQFTRAVRDALSSFRFRPAESNGKRVQALAEMPFEFKVTR